MRYMVVVAEGSDSFGAYVPDLPGCVAAAESRDEVIRLIREAIEFYREGMKQDGMAIPAPHSTSELVEVRAA
jgi:predicted RNase H-like HicB family nuclease